jgi:pimeloyl-ACP methyl ester carboxylesterase
MTDRTVEVKSAGTSVPLAVSEAGAGGRPLLLVPGFTGAKEDFADWLPALADRGWHVVAPDLRGHGGSHAPHDEADYSFEIYADDVVGLIDALGWSQVVVLGHSMGGMVVQTALLQAPERFTGLVLMNTSHRGLRADPELIELAVAVARAEGMPAILAAQAAAVDSPLPQSAAAQRLLETRPGYQAFGEQKLLASSPAMYAAMIGPVTDRRDVSDRLPALGSVGVPTLVVVGEQDRPFLAPSLRLAEAIPGATLAVIPDAGHAPQFENPDAWWAAVAAFLDGL